jgi:aspartyl-tRNA synthetase
MLRTHTCGELNRNNLDQTVTLTGWVASTRNHGGLIFINLRDRYGLTQITFDPQTVAADLMETIKTVRAEWVLKVTGRVAARPDKMINDQMPTGAIEIIAEAVEILNRSKLLPFEINEDKTGLANEALRLKYRYLDLRRPKLQAMLKTKNEFIIYIREYFHRQNFIEVQTPILAFSSPEGARDFLIPSRLYPGKFYALPQAPQQFKQLLMVGGLDKYFQIAPCFRDEDPRMDRAYGEFYQLDMEMSFVEQEDVFKVMEPLMIELTEKFSQKKITNLLPNGRLARLTWTEAIDKYGSDKPDLRFDNPLIKIDEAATGSGFSVFDSALAAGGTVRAWRVPGGAKFTRKEIDELVELAKRKGASGLAYLTMKEGQLASPIAKFMTADKLAAIATAVGLNDGDIAFLAAVAWRETCGVLGAIRNEVGSRLGLKDNTKAAWLLIGDFTMYDYSELEEGRIDFAHNPFSMPQGGLNALQTKAPLDILAYQYDLVLNGFEVSSGAIRNHDPEIMYEAFRIAGYSREQVETRFGALINAFAYGAPPHGGNAPGIDRILMVLNDWDSIRDIYAFPKDSLGRDLMSDSPSAVDDYQLDELHIKLDLPAEPSPQK